MVARFALWWWCSVSCGALACGGAGDRGDGVVDTGVGPTDPDPEDSDGSSGVLSTDGTSGDPTTIDPSAGSTGAVDSTGSLATSGAGDTSTGEVPFALDEVGALVVLGDSISDGGGQSPYYYDLLRVDLEARYGAIEYVNRAQSGSETDALDGQAAGLPAALPGPVVVVITSGGNDMKSAIGQIVTGTDGPARAQMQANIEAALAELLAPGRFGAGVEVYVLEGNIYDASDGVGDFGAHDCAFGGSLPAIPTDPFFMAWNDAIRTAVEGADQLAVDMHAHFYGHGYAGEPSWYASDCTHPNVAGHDALRRLFYQQISGEPLP